MREAKKKYVPVEHSLSEGTAEMMSLLTISETCNHVRRRARDNERPKPLVGSRKSYAQHANANWEDFRTVDPGDS